jgi:hypothetical protein
MTDEQYERLVSARARGRNPDDRHDDDHAWTMVLAAVSALQTAVLVQRREIAALQADVQQLRALESDTAC